MYLGVRDGRLLVPRIIGGGEMVDEYWLDEMEQDRDRGDDEEHHPDLDDEFFLDVDDD